MLAFSMTFHLTFVSIITQLAEPCLNPPNKKARREIDAKLTASGWLVQDRDDLDLTAGRGIAVRNFTMKPGHGFADYLLYLDRKAVGAVEAKAEGTLRGVEAQSAKYSHGLPDTLPAHRRPLPFLFEANGTIVHFTNGLDPVPRSREIFSFPRPETLAAILAQPQTLRALLRQMPPVDDTWPGGRAVPRHRGTRLLARPRRPTFAGQDDDGLRQDLHRRHGQRPLCAARQRRPRSLPRGPP